MLIMDKNCSENLVSANHFLRDHEPWPPMVAYDNGREDDFGLIRISGNNNSVISNHISETIDRQYLKPCGVTPVIIYVEKGHGNYIANNHIVATTEGQKEEDREESCFSAQVGALLTIDSLKDLEVTAVFISEQAVKNTVLDTCKEEEGKLDREKNVFRALP